MSRDYGPPSSVQAAQAFDGIAAQAVPAAVGQLGRARARHGSRLLPREKVAEGAIFLWP